MSCSMKTSLTAYFESSDGLINVVLMETTSVIRGSERPDILFPLRDFDVHPSF